MKETIESVSKRLQVALSKRGMKQSDLVEKTKIPKGSISQYVSGYVEPKSDRIYLLAKALDVNPVWLMGVDVGMEIENEKYSEDNAHLLNKIKNDPTAMRIMKKYFELSDEQKSSIVTIVEGMAQNNH